LGKLWAGIFITRQHNFELWNFIKAEFLKVNPARNSSGALNPAGIILKSNPAAAAGTEGLWPGGSSVAF